MKLTKYVWPTIEGLVVLLFCGMAYNSYQNAQASKTARQAADNAVVKESRKTSNLIDRNRNQVVYLAPKGAKSKVDVNTQVIDQIMRKTFKYNSPKQFYTQAQFLKNRVEGPFYKYWFGNGIKASYEALELQANGSTLKRGYRNYVLVKKAHLHYFAVISTYTKLGYDQHSTPNITTYALDFTWNARTNRWHVTALPNVHMQ